MKLAILVLTITLSSAAIMSGCEKQVKSKEHLIQHYEEMQVEAKHCIELAKKNIDIRQNETCMNVVEVMKKKCAVEMSKMGNFFSVGCDDGPQMLGLAARGF